MSATRSFKSSERGLALMDVTIALAIFSLTTAGFVSFLLSSKALERETRDRAEAVALAREVTEQIRSCSFEQVFARFNNDPNDDPNGPGTAPGALMTRRRAHRALGNRDRCDDIDEAVGNLAPSMVAIRFPTDATGAQIREDLPNPDLGTPCDLNGDGMIDSADHRTDLAFLPVQVQVSFPTATGTRQIRMHTVLSRR